MTNDTQEVDPERKGNQPEGHEQFTVADMANQNARFFETRPDADKGLEKAQEVNGVEAELFPPGTSPEWMYHAEGERPDDAETDGGETEVVGETQSVQDTDDKPIPVDAEPVEPTPDAPGPDELPERSVSDDPLTWMPGHFIDQIDGTPAINRKGFEVLAHHYDISTTAELEVPPEETDHEYVRVKARAETGDGRVAEAFGSAHVDRGDDAELLLEMADTRARKRALSIATGVGVVAVSELKNDIEQ